MKLWLYLLCFLLLPLPILAQQNKVVVIPLNGSSACPTALTNCSGSCVDLSSDENHCGSCPTICNDGERCNGGVCQLSCQTGLTNCSGKCIDLTNDEDHCGSCPTICSPTQRCITGTCQTI